MVHRATGRTGSTLFVHNLADRPCRLNLAALRDPEQPPLNFVADADYGKDVDLDDINVAGLRLPLDPPAPDDRKLAWPAGAGCLAAARRDLADLPVIIEAARQTHAQLVVLAARTGEPTVPGTVSQ